MLWTMMSLPSCAETFHRPTALRFPRMPPALPPGLPTSSAALPKNRLPPEPCKQVETPLVENVLDARDGFFAGHGWHACPLHCVIHAAGRWPRACRRPRPATATATGCSTRLPRRAGLTNGPPPRAGSGCRLGLSFCQLPGGFHLFEGGGVQAQAGVVEQALHDAEALFELGIGGAHHEFRVEAAHAC